MATRRMSIRLFDHERWLLIEQYLRWRIPIDQFESRPEDLRDFVVEWSKASGRKDAGSELIHYMRTQRKRGLWVTLDGNHESSPPIPPFTPEETETLVSIHYENVTSFENGSDVLAYEPELADLIAREFAAETGRIVPAHILVAKLTALRKRGLLEKIGRRDKDTKHEKVEGFEDIPDVGT